MSSYLIFVLRRVLALEGYYLIVGVRHRNKSLFWGQSYFCRPSSKSGTVRDILLTIALNIERVKKMLLMTCGAGDYHRLHKTIVITLSLT